MRALALLCLAGSTLAADNHWGDEGIVQVDRSLDAKLHTAVRAAALWIRIPISTSGSTPQATNAIKGAVTLYRLPSLSFAVREVRSE